MYIYIYIYEYVYVCIYIYIYIILGVGLLGSSLWTQEFITAARAVGSRTRNLDFRGFDPSRFLVFRGVLFGP